MSFAGGLGHKSPFAERAKATKSHLSPRRSSAASGTGSARSAQQSLFGKESSFGGKESQFGDSSAKVSQLRNAAQPDVKEPTTPTRTSEGSPMKGNRRDEFSSFNNRRVGTPVKTPRTAFGTIPPRSPKRPYVGSPKYQKVLLERPAFYNSPAEGEPLMDSGKKEVSISELQKRLKRFLQDENVPSRSQLEVAPSNNLDEVPYNISRSPRVNPLFHHDNTVLQVAKGGVAFTAGVDLTDENTCLHSNEKEDHNAGFYSAKGGVTFIVGEFDSTYARTPEDMGADVGTELLRTPSEAAPLVSQSLSEGVPDSNDVSNEASEASETEQSLSPKDFPVHSEGGGGSQVEEVCDSEVVVAEVSDSKELLAELEPQSIATSVSGIVMVQECPLKDATPLLNSSADEISEEKAQEEAHVEVEKITLGAAEEHQLEAKADCTSEEEVEEEIETLESWSQRFLKLVVLAVMVACTMGFMVLASGSQGLLPKSLHLKPVAGPLSTSLFTPCVIPISIGFMGLEREHEGMPCLPSVHLGLKFLSSTSNDDASQQESSPSFYTSGSNEPISDARKYSKLAGIDNVMDLDELKTVTDYYKELQGRLFSDVASLTSDSGLSESSKAGMAIDGEQIAAVEDVLEIVASEEAAEDVPYEDVLEVAAIEELEVFEEVSESAAMEDISEVVNDVADVQFKILPRSDDFGHEVSQETLPAINPGNLQIILDATSDSETEKLPADLESNVLILVNHLSDEKLQAEPTNEFNSSETTEYLSPDSSDLVSNPQPAEINRSVIELSITEPASHNVSFIPDEVAGVLDVSPVTEDIFTDEHTIASYVQEIVEDSSLGSSDNVEDLVDDHAEEHVYAHQEEPRSQSTTAAALLHEGHVQPLAEVTSHIPVSDVVVPEETALEEPVAEGSNLMGIIGVLAVALALAVAILNIRKSPTVFQAADTSTEVNLFPGTTDALKTMGSPVAWPSVRSVYDSHVPDRDELDAITSPLIGIRTSRKYGMESHSTKYGSVEPALSAPGFFESQARVVQKPATTWHPAMKDGGSTISSSWRQTASYIPTRPSESGISTSTRGASETDSVCESALSMGAEEWEHLGSFTTTELVSVMHEGGEEHKVRTPVRRSQRIRNRVSPLPPKYDGFL